MSPPTIFVSNLLPREICLPIDHHTVWLQRLVNTSWSLQYQGCWWFFCRNLWVFGLRRPLLKHFWFTYGCPVHKTFYFLHISLPFSVSLSFFTRPRQISSLIYPLTDWLPPHSHFLLQLASGHSNSVLTSPKWAYMVMFRQCKAVSILWTVSTVSTESTG